MLASLPAIIALIGCLATARLLHSGRSTNLSWCQAIASNAADDGDSKTAAVCYARLLQAHPSDRPTAFNLAQSLQSLGQPEGARSLMARLASPEGGSYAPAHLWLAAQTLLQANPSNESLDTAADHLSKAIQAFPQDSQANYWSAILFARRGQWDNAGQFASKAGDRYASLCQTLRQIASSQGNTTQAELWAARGH